MNRWNGCPGIVAVIILAVFLSTMFLAGNGHGNPVVEETQNIIHPRVADAVVGTRRAVSPRATEEVAESISPRMSDAIVGTRSPVSSCATVEVAETQTSNTDKPSPPIFRYNIQIPKSPLEPVCG